MADAGTIIRVGPQHAGQRMSLDEFARAAEQPGHTYELEKGVVVAVAIRGLPHALVVQAIRDALTAYRSAHPGSIYLTAEGGSAGVRMPEMESERHPDIAVYLTSPPTDDPQPWDFWTPDLVVEVVSPGSEQRDYEVKRDEYLKAGIRLYWVIDPQQRSATVFTRRGDTWEPRRLDEGASLSTPLLAGFELRLADVFGVLK